MCVWDGRSSLLYPTLLQLALCLVSLPASAIRHDLTGRYAFFGALLLSRRLHTVELWVTNSPPTCLQHLRKVSVRGHVIVDTKQ